MGAIAGLMEAQYNILRKKGHTPSEAFNETVEEATQSLIPLIGENGMDWMFAHCSTTAQRGALDWKPKFRKAVEPVFEELPEDDPKVRKPDISKAEKLLGWKPNVGIEEGIEKTVEYFRSQI